MIKSSDTTPARSQYNIDAIVLAGGEGRRMEGENKGLILWREKPLVAHVLERIAPQVDRIVISANRALSHYREFGLKVCPDSRPGFQGPLAGIEACTAFCQADYTLIVGCDMPLLPSNLSKRLMETLSSDAVAATFVDDGKRQHYLCALVKTPTLGTISAYLDTDQRSVKGWLHEIGAQETHFTDSPSAFRNINHPDDM